ncbi:MAG: nucleotidyl transferase AbiEii/AbiGii toxin family protein [Candidatus Shapirobacteria bacterium]
MTIELLDKSILSILNRQLKYPLAIAEKDYFLALVCKIIYQSKLKNQIIFKGGTAIYHTYLPQLRFSEDLDFSSNQEKIDINKIKSIFTNYDFLEIKKDYLSNATYKIERLLYTGPLNQSNSLKLEIDFLQNVVLSPIKMDYHNQYGIKTKIMVMDIREIVAEKIRAMNDRVRYRDFYDFTMINKKLSIDLKYVFSLVKQKEIRKTISPKNIKSNWTLAKLDKQNDYQSIYFSEQLSDAEIEIYLSKLNFSEISK